jgi:uridine phosphorylase
MRKIPVSELVINNDGSVFHLHVKPSEIADTILLVGDPNRVNMVAKHFDKIECEVQNREFHTITGFYKEKRISCVSHGIGTDNIDIVATELDVLANIDFATREERSEHKRLTLVRVGTSGGLQPELPIGSFVVACRSIGFDGLLNFYDVPSGIFDLEFERAFCNFTQWNCRLPAPYVVSADEELVRKIGFDMVQGTTISAPGFYGPQGRYVRAKPIDENLNKKIIDFNFNGEKINNFEMESSALAGLSKHLGHKAVTICAIIAGRATQNMNTNYKNSMEDLVKIVLDRI